MSIWDQLTKRYGPLAEDAVELRDDGNGPYIVKWNVKDADGNAINGPNDDELKELAKQASAAPVVDAPPLAAGELLSYRGLKENIQLPGNITLALDFSEDLEGAAGYPVTIPESGLYEIELRLYAFAGSTAIARGYVERTDLDGAATRYELGEQLFYSYIPFVQKGLLHFDRGDRVKAFVGWGSAQYPKRIMARRGADRPSTTFLLIRKA